MNVRLNIFWLALILLAALFGVLYLWYTIFPGHIPGEVYKYFSVEQVQQGRQYNRMLRLSYSANFLMQGTFLAWLLFSGRGMVLSRWCQHVMGGSHWGGLLAFSTFLWLMLSLLNLPFSLFNSYYWQHRWGFSTQSLGNWWLDYVKEAGIELLFFIIGVILLFWIIGRWPKIWWRLGASLFSLWLIIQTFIWPVVISPLFNRFEPARNPVIINIVQQLAQKAKLPVDQVLIMDASRRTTKANAYFTGLGRTKRIVLYDTLVEDYSPDEIEAVVAHEMGHWSHGHIVEGVGWGIAGLFLFWGILFLVLRQSFSREILILPQTLTVVLLFIMLVSFVSSPLQNYISRNMEKEADQTAVVLTGNVPAAVELEVNLAAKNLSDVSPAPFIEWFSYSHPSVLKRIAVIESAGKNMEK